MKTSTVIVFLCLSFFIASFKAQAQPRTWGYANHLRDPGFDKNHIFNNFKPVDNYRDPDFTEAIKEPSPLYNPIYASYDLLIVVQRGTYAKNKKGELVPQDNARMKVYVREEALSRIHPNQTQYMQYDRASGLVYYFRISTARLGKVTKPGYYPILGFSSRHESSKYNNAPMPWAVNFLPMYYTHGVVSELYGALGSPASAGCIRMETQRAKDLFHLIGMVGEGMVDVLDRNGRPIRGDDHQIQKKYGYKSLIIIR